MDFKTVLIIALVYCCCELGAAATVKNHENRPEPVIKGGRFYNPWTTWKWPCPIASLYWLFFLKDRTPLPSASALNKTLPVLKPNFTQNRDGIQVTWLGHATIVIQMEGYTILTDPIFSHNDSPVTFAAHRFRRVACKIKELPKIDAVVISHNHYDHLDLQSIRELCRKPRIRWFVPLGVRKLLKEAGCTNVQEMTWWEEVNLTPKFRIACTPAQHWSKRGLFDTNKSLWASWSLLGAKYRFFFAGDTGYPTEQQKPNIFDMIREDYGPFDLAAIPIGAYAPRWLMEKQHVNPEQAVKIHKEIGATHSVAIHWGTYRLANEPYLEPKLQLEELMESDKSFTTLKHGETKCFKRP